ncbi:MAG: DUF167 domain-containing protein [Pararhodobacter sp.]|nr:DUF167 domain-containing protein [Pararhodobacter sp.]
MARPRLPDLSSLVRPGARFAVKVAPRASENTLETGEVLRIRVTAAPTDGKATEAARRLLAQALGVAPTRLCLIRGETSRDKLFQLDD